MVVYVVYEGVFRGLEMWMDSNGVKCPNKDEVVAVNRSIPVPMRLAHTIPFDAHHIFQINAHRKIPINKRV